MLHPWTRWRQLNSARNMSQSTSSRDACSIASEWEDQRVTSLTPGDSWTILCLYSGVRKMAPRDQTYRRLQGTSFVGILKMSVAMIQCIRSSGWTGYMLMEVGMTFLRLALLKSPCDDRGSVRVFVDCSRWALRGVWTKPSSCLPEVECKRQ